MSRFGYTGEKQMNTIAQKMAEQHIPVDAVVFDLFWFGDSIKGTLGNLNWENRVKWPNPQKMLQQLRQSSIRPILITEPFFLKGTRNYEQAKRYLATDSAGNPFTLQDFYFGKGGILDIFRKDAGDWIWNIHYKKQIANGTAGWWTDLAEPEKHPQGIRHNLSALGFNRKFGADEVHNAFSHYWSKMLYDKYAVHHPDIRLFHLTRSGFAGSQRYSIFPWSGDVSRSWKGLQAQLKIMQGMSLSGIPYMHADAGGFAGGNGDKELYVRWLQFAAFTPIFRPHGTALGDVDPNAFDFPSEPALIDTPYNRTARSVIDLRYRMLPYNYTLSYQQTKEGTPLTAPLFYHFPQDSVCYRATDQFMWGSSILVAPVTEKGMSNRKVYLPEGYWYRLNNQFSISGVAPEKGWVDCALTGEEIPFFAKAGSIIPTRKLPEGSNTARYSTDTLVIHYFPDDKPSDYVLYDDDGESRNALKKGNYQLIRFRANPEVGGKTRIRVSAGNGSFNGKPRKRLMYFIVHGTGNSNDKTDSEKNYSGSIVFTGNPQQIVVQ
jgi:oligosaccharide 4-alpha-D-glucosyltransferase